MRWQSATIGVSFALFLVWMERKGRWTLFAKAIGGDYVVAGSRGGAKGQAPSSGPTDNSGNTPSATLVPNATGPGIPASSNPGGLTV